MASSTTVTAWRALATSSRTYATHVKTPLLLPTAPPDPPRPPQAQQASSRPSSTPSSPSTPSSSKPTAPPSSLPKPRLDYAALLANPNRTTANFLARKAPLGKDHVAHLQRLRDTQLILLGKLEAIRAKQKEISTAIKHGLTDREESVRQAKKLKLRAAEYEVNLSATESELLDMALALPNTSHADSPLGPEEHAEQIELFGPEVIPADAKRDHLSIANHYGWVDNEASVTATGSSWPYLKGALALLEHALVNYALSKAIAHGYTPVSPPDVVRTDIAWRCGFQPRDTEGQPTQTYHLQTGDNAPELCLAGTAEIPLSGLFANRILDAASLPSRVVGVGRAFRAEAGARGADTRGLYRVHQFTKVELFTVCPGEVSQEEMDKMRDVQREIAQGLGLTVRVLEMPTEELGASASRKWDMEAWMPGRGKWGEITSTSNCTDYQARRLHIRIKPSVPDKKAGLPFAYTLNGTAGAIPRLLVALIENGARFDEHGQLEGINLPSALRPFWIGGEVVGEKNKGEIKWVAPLP